MPYGEKSAYAAQAALKKKSPAYMKSSGFKMKRPPMKELSNSEKAKLEGASDEIVQKLKNIEAGEKKLSEITDPEQKARVEAKLKELQPRE